MITPKTKRPFYLRWARSRTMHMAGLVAALGAVEAGSGVIHQALQPILGDAWAGMVLVAVGAIAAYLRTVTTKPLGDK